MEALAARAPGGLIVVSVNYRLNTLGFLAVRELAEEDGWVANQGIADGIAALQWVQSNIGFFGGDKTRVTLMGQSSGGRSSSLCSQLLLLRGCSPVQFLSAALQTLRWTQRPSRHRTLR